VYTSVAVVALLAAAVWRLTSNTMMMGLVTPAISFHCDDDTGENPSFFGTKLIAQLVSFSF